MKKSIKFKSLSLVIAIISLISCLVISSSASETFYDKKTAKGLNATFSKSWRKTVRVAIYDDNNLLHEGSMDCGFSTLGTDSDYVKRFNCYDTVHYARVSNGVDDDDYTPMKQGTIATGTARVKHKSNHPTYYAYFIL